MTYVFKQGVAAAICDRCGFKFRRDQLRTEWTGYEVCSGPGTNNCWEPRHPQDLVRGVADHQAIRNPRPDPEPVYLSENEVTADSL